jgi:hypothetical protein
VNRFLSYPTALTVHEQAVLVTAVFFADILLNPAFPIADGIIAQISTHNNRIRHSGTARQFCLENDGKSPAFLHIGPRTPPARHKTPGIAGHVL